MNIIRIHPGIARCKIKAPFFLSRIYAGFPSPADDYLDKKLDLNEFLIRHPAATFFVRVKGDSMINAGIHTGRNIFIYTGTNIRFPLGLVQIMEHSHFGFIVCTSFDLLCTGMC